MTLIGSVAKGTATTPAADVDLVFQMPVGTHARIDGYAGNGQSALLQEVRGVLQKRWPRTDIRGDGPVVVVGFIGGVSVEVVPGVLFSGSPDFLHAHCLVPMSRNGGSWERANYGAQFDTFLGLDTELVGQYGRLVRYMKVWRRVQNVTFKSIAIELMAADFMQAWDRSHTTYTYDDWLVRDFLEYAVGHWLWSYTIPGSGKQIDTGSGWFSAARTSHTDAKNACIWGDTSALYSTYWKKVLGDDFGR